MAGQTQQATDAANAGLLNFGEGAFPAATQAAFGLGGSGIGYGGNATGGTISFPSASGGGVQQQAAAAPAGGASNYMPILLIGGLILVGLLVVMGMGGMGEIEKEFGGHHRRRRR